MASALPLLLVIAFAVISAANSGFHLPAMDEEERTPLHSAMKGLALDRLGPVVIQEDGTMSRVANWAEMTMSEKEKTVRVVTERNHERMEAMKAKQEHATERMWAGSPAQRAPSPFPFRDEL